MRLPKLKKLNTKGLGHHVLIAVLVISGIAGFGAWRVYSSSAAVTAASVCGSGYSVLSSKALTNNVNARSYLLINRGAQKICGVTMSTGASYGKSRYLEVHSSFTKNSDGKYPVRYQDDHGDFKYYAGPVYSSYKGVDTRLYDAHIWSRADIGRQSGYATIHVDL